MENVCFKAGIHIDSQEIATAVEEKFQQLTRKRNREISKLPRPERRMKDNRSIVQQYWDMWQKEPSLYPSIKTFDLAMQDNTTVKRLNTIQEWRKILESGGRLTG